MKATLVKAEVVVQSPNEVLLKMSLEEASVLFKLVGNIGGYCIDNQKGVPLYIDPALHQGSGPTIVQVRVITDKLYYELKRAGVV